MILIRYFGRFSQITEKKKETMEIRAHETVESLVRLLVIKYGRDFQEFYGMSRTTCTLNGVILSSNDAKISDGDELIFSTLFGGG